MQLTFELRITNCVTNIDVLHIVVQVKLDHVLQTSYEVYYSQDWIKVHCPILNDDILCIHNKNNGVAKDPKCSLNQVYNGIRIQLLWVEFRGNDFHCFICHHDFLFSALYWTEMMRTRRFLLRMSYRTFIIKHLLNNFKNLKLLNVVPYINTLHSSLNKRKTKHEPFIYKL